jgi:leucine-rich repeat protein SHOC2
MTQLTLLNASQNEMTDLIAEIGKLKQLETLNLSNNSLTDLPDELLQLTNLKTLDLSNNPINPDEIIKLKSNLSSANIIN